MMEKTQTSMLPLRGFPGQRGTPGRLHRTSEHNNHGKGDKTRPKDYRRSKLTLKPEPNTLSDMTEVGKQRET